MQDSGNGMQDLLDFQNAKDECTGERDAMVRVRGLSWANARQWYAYAARRGRTRDDGTRALDGPIRGRVNHMIFKLAGIVIARIVTKGGANGMSGLKAIACQEK